MKLVFICGCLEPGEDGVGDYTRRLAGELVREGHRAAILAFYDRKVQKIETDFQMENETPVEVMRIPAGFDAKIRFQTAKEFINNKDPEWLSLQFVPYSYDNKGLPLSLGNQLKNLGATKKWHIMFHELWGGLPRPKNLREALLSFFQKTIIKVIYLKLSPLKVSTSIPYYKEVFFSKDINLLPLFGNIKFQQTCKKIKTKSLIAVHFGGFSGKFQEWELQLNWVKTYGLLRKQKVELWIIGGGGAHKGEALSVAKKVFDQNNIKDLGRLSANEISRNFQQADIGISRSGSMHYGKSSSTISMLEHGLPVLLQGKRLENKLDQNFLDERIYFCDDDIQKDLQRGKPNGRLNEVAKLFVDQLGE